MKDKNIKIKQRQSGIELLKIFAIFLIVVSHVSQSLYTDGTYAIGANDYFIDLSLPTLSPLTFFLSLCRYAGALGNTLFIVSTCWFLCGQKKYKFKKIISMWLNTYIISMIFLLITSLILGFSNIDKDYVLQSFLPNIFKNNWYVTYYLIFCIVYPIINIILEKIGKVPHLILAIGFFIYCFILSFAFKFFASDRFVTWIASYLVISYFRTYKQSIFDNKKISVISLILSFVLGMVLVIVYNNVGVNNPDLKLDILHFNLNHNPFTFVFGLSSVCIFSTFKFSSKFINRISSLSLFVYLIHENLLFRRYFRLMIWEKIYTTFGFTHLLGWFLIYSIGLFVASIVVSFVYDITINRLINLIINKVSGLFSKKEKSLQP